MTFPASTLNLLDLRDRSNPLEQDVELIQTILQLFAIRVGAEIERSQAHQKLQAQEQFLRAIYEGTQQPMFVIDADSDQALHYVSLNTSAEAFFGCNCTAIQGKTPEELYGPGIRDTVQQFLRFVDNGPGIAEEIQTQMFDPFFTTKPVG